MARFKPPGSRKAPPAKSSRAYIPCVILIVAGFLLVFWLFYALMRSGT